MNANQSCVDPTWRDMTIDAIRENPGITNLVLMHRLGSSPVTTQYIRAALDSLIADKKIVETKIKKGLYQYEAH